MSESSIEHGRSDRPRVHVPSRLAAFAAASLSCSLAPGLGVPIVLRVVQAGTRRQSGPAALQEAGDAVSGLWGPVMTCRAGPVRG